MALYRFLFAPVLLAVAVFQGGGGRPHEHEQRADAVVQAVRRGSAPARPVPAAARAPSSTHRAEADRLPASR